MRHGSFPGGRGLPLGMDTEITALPTSQRFPKGTLHQKRHFTKPMQLILQMSLVCQQ